MSKAGLNAQQQPLWLRQAQPPLVLKVCKTNETMKQCTGPIHKTTLHSNYHSKQQWLG